MLRFAIKVGIAGSAVYYLNQEGIWKESRESLKAYDKLNITLQPYVQEVKKQIPVELPEIPKSENFFQTTQLYWNKGVTTTFGFLSELPGLVSTWTRNGIEALMENPEIKKLLNSSATENTK